MMSTADRLYNSFRNNLSRLSQRKLKQGIVAAYSGGPDSSVLLDMLVASGIPVFPYYFAHFIRDDNEQNAEIAFVEERCREYGLSLKIGGTEPGLIERGGRTDNIGIEAYARKIRYRGLEQYRKEVKGGYIFTAHTLDDDMETAVMRFFQGSPFLQGIPCERNSIVRPLLHSRKEEIWAYIRERGIQYAVDSSNADDRYLRNSLRVGVMKNLETVFPGFPGKYIEYKRRSLQLQNFLRDEMHRQLPWKPGSDETSMELNAAVFDKASRYLQTESLLECASRILKNREKRIPRVFFEGLPENTASRRVQLTGHGLQITRKGAMLKIEKAFFASEEDYVYILQNDVPCVFGRLECMITAAVTPGWDTVLDLKDNSGPFFLRSRRPGDRIKVDNLTKEIKKLYNDWSIPPEYRGSIPVFGNSRAVLAVLAVGYGGKNQLSNAIEKDTIRSACNKVGTFLVVRGV